MDRLTPDAGYTYEWLPGSMVSSELLEECSVLFSRHYGIWGAQSERAGQRVRLSAGKIRGWLASNDSNIACARYHGELIGYAIAVQAKIKCLGIISWVTQLVVHEQHRRQGIGKNLLFSIWSLSSHFAWGIVSSNPYAIRALEKATRRRCIPARVARSCEKLLNLGEKVAPYIRSDIERVINQETSRINTDFPVDHSEVDAMIARVSTQEAPWLMGSLEEGWEWLAFTFNDQEQISLTAQEVDKMLSLSDQITRQAFSRMRLGTDHGWARFASEESSFIAEHCALKAGDRVLDLGCGSGRHAIALAEMGMVVTGADYTSDFIRNAQREAEKLTENKPVFVEGDCRELDFEREFDAVLCLYDVIGTYAENSQNIRILENIAKHLKPGGQALLSVMNYELTARQAKNVVSVMADPDSLLRLPSSNIMEKTGNIFDPEYYLIDRDSNIVYRKEAFSEGNHLPVELIVRDRRFTQDEIERLCAEAGLQVIWSRFVRAGRWDAPLSRDNDGAKEILVLCKKAG